MGISRQSYRTFIAKNLISKETAGSGNNSKVYDIFPAVSKYYQRGRTKKINIVLLWRVVMT
jgi:hypothetical protein